MPAKASRAIANPLALAVLAILAEGPAHPYEIGRLLRERRKERSIKLNDGSLYAVVDRLHHLGFIVPTETERQGRLPERTVYALTEAGHAELVAWMRELIGTWHKEYPQFESALAMVYVLPPDEVATLLGERRRRLDEVIERERADQREAADRGVPRLFLVEAGYRLALLEAERGCVEDVQSLISEGDPAIDDWWRQLTSGGRPR